jgi:hypothetical protein
VELRGKARDGHFTATAQVLSGPMKGRRWTISSDGPKPGEVLEVAR